MAKFKVPKAPKFDDRTPKLMGILLLFLAFYMLVAFLSYLFTWRDDQSIVLRFSWNLLFEDIPVDNFLGRLGAILSNLLIYWGFGLPSFALVILSARYGRDLLNDKPLTQNHESLKFYMVGMAVFAVLLEFFFGWADFPIGGTFGDVVCTWLKNLMGSFGIFCLLVAALCGLVVWRFNPDFENMTIADIVQEIREHFTNLWNGRYTSSRRPALTSPRRTNNASAANNAAAASMAEGRTLDMNSDASPLLAEAMNTATPASRVGQRDTALTPASPSAAAVTDATDAGTEALTLGGDTTRRSGPALRAGGGAELEIEPSATEATADGLEIPPIPPSKPVQASLFEAGAPLHGQHFDINTPYDPTLDLSTYEYPVTALLLSYDESKMEIDRAELEQNKDQIIETLLNYKIEITKIRATIGPTVTLYEIVPAPGVRISRIKNLEDDIALSLAALGIRIIAPIPGRGTIGIEVPNKNKQVVSLKEVLQSEKFRRSDMDLPIALGKTISNEVFVADLAKMPHLLIAGATGQGKSVGINTILMSLLYKKHPSQVKLIMIDPKKVELSPYSKIENHFLGYLPDQMEPIVTDTQQVIHTLNSLVILMETRYDMLKKAQARNIKEYNEKFVARKLNPEKGHEYMPFVVLVIDEFADLIMTAGKEIELPIGRLAQLSRAVGIHLIIATQRPSVNIITGVIKANFPVRIAFKVASKVDSRTILDGGGADQLIGRGDMLISFGSDTIRLQCAFVDTPEVERVIDFIAAQPGYPTPYFLPEYKAEEMGDSPKAVRPEDLDDMFDDSARLVVQNQHGSTSMIQRRLKLGYNRAGRIMDQLQSMGIVGPAEGSKPREVLIYDEAELERFLGTIRRK